MQHTHLMRLIGLLMISAIAAAVVAACSSDPETIIQTVIVEKEVAGAERTVIVEKEVPVAQTVVVEKEVTVDRTVVVNRTVVVEATPVPVVETFFGLPLPVVPADVGTAPPPQSASNTVVIRSSLELRGSGFGSDYTGAFTAQSVTEKLFMTDKGGNAVPLVAASWVLATDLTTLDVTLKQGVQFHGGFGELTAEDVAWSINTGNPGYNPESATDGGSSWITFLGNNPVTVVDTYTVRFTIAAFDPRWATFILGQSGLGLSITSKAAFDQNGESWVRDHVIGTGPYKVDNFSRDDILELSAVANHHRITPEVKKLVYRAIPDDAVAEAALKTGSVDVSQVSLRNMTGLQKAGFKAVGAGAGSFHSISFSGNYWETTHYITGDPLVSNFSNGTYNGSPWIGRPGNAESMEKARLVRTALSLAIDRDLISEVLFAGVAWPNYVYGADTHNPNWQEKWATPYNPTLAGQLLDQAGFPKGSNGIRFEMPFFIRIGRGDEEIGTAVVGMWREIGIDVQDWKAQYQTYRPNLIGRTAVAPWIHSAGAEGPQQPWDWPVMGSTECSRGRGGFNIGVEIVELCKFFDDMSVQGDVAERNKLRDANVEFLAHWMPVIGTIAEPQVALINPNKIATWDMPLSVREAAVHHPEFIKLK